MAAENSLSEANATFCLDLLSRLGSADMRGNVIFSPFSISSALAMVMLGAKGDTRKQMSECLRTQACQEDVHASFGKLLHNVGNKEPMYSLCVANRLYGEQSFQFLQGFLSSSREFYEAELEPVDFRKGFEAARLNINSWVANKTEGKIKDLLSQGLVGSLTTLVLVNAIYFKAMWEKEFLGKDTSDGMFRVSKTEKRAVRMMYQQSTFPVAIIPELNFKILELPYKGNDLSMLIFLPDEIEDNSTGLEKLEKTLTYENFVKWTHRDMMKPTFVSVHLPQFKIEEKYDMKNVLISMGMVDAFDPARSDFSGMSPGKDLVVSDVVHKAFVEVNEKGTEAAAATAAIMLLGCCMSDLYFTADHPFLFFIRHNPTSSLLFTGRFCSPE
ncbi:leukocyte elastase inhibitor A-like [Synchiropus splendidus]|uniref:leukocyte elastase inhibitor A-like n=1 Tax=Synchiropus splendidus TaxID=270530 RepID=UPI00237D33D4|nr:leukocyte elastase inhibitor A-like [Synchiropus splendidus]